MFRVKITLLAVIAAHSMGSASAQTKVYDPILTFPTEQDTETDSILGIQINDAEKTISVSDIGVLRIPEETPVRRLRWSAWSLSTGTKVSAVKKSLSIAISPLSFITDDKWVIAGGVDKGSTTFGSRKLPVSRIIVWSASTGQVVRDWTYPRFSIVACRISPNRDRMAIIAGRFDENNRATGPFHFQIIDALSGKPLLDTPEKLDGLPTGLCFSSNGRQVHVCHLNQVVSPAKEPWRALVTSYGKRQLRRLHSQQIQFSSVSGWGAFRMPKVCATDNGWVTVCEKGDDATEWFLDKTIGHITVGTRRNRRIAWSFQDVGISPASSSRDGLVVYNNIAPINVRGFGYNHIAVRSATTGKLIYQLRGQKTQITGLALANGGRQVVSADDKGTIRVWDLPPMAGRSESSTAPQP